VLQSTPACRRIFPTLMTLARGSSAPPMTTEQNHSELDFVMKRVMGIEPASRAWELHDLGRTQPLTSGFDLP
jgi:hypothetical protein